jgi:hypothetical protein
MPRSELPREFEGALTWEQLLEFLSCIEGDEVFVAAGHSAARLRVLGTLGPISLGTEEVRYAIGGINQTEGPSLLFTRQAFEAARLITLDGNDYYRFLIQFDGLTVSVVDEDSGP